nr:AAA family ATPase [Corynebacterium lactis]
MRFYEIELHNVRGIESLAIRDIADRGVIVISGENESGKTTIAKALEAALTTKWKSQSAATLSLRSNNTQDKPHIKVRMELDGYEFTLDKVFGNTKDAGTTITVHSPHAETLKDDAAEKWLEQRRDSADTEKLWQVFVAEQGQAQKTLSLGGFTQVTNALQTATGQRAETVAESGLYDAARELFEEYYAAKSGKPKKPLVDAEKALNDARSARIAAAETVRNFDALNEEAANNEESQKAQRELLPEAQAEVARWAKAAEELQQFRLAVDSAKQANEAAVQRHEAAKREMSGREALIDELKKATSATEKAQKILQDREEAYQSEKKAIAEAQSTRDTATEKYRQARKVEDIAAAEVALAEKRAVVAGLADKASSIEKLREKLAEHRATVAKNPVDDEALDKLHKAEGKLRTATAVLQASSPTAVLSASALASVSFDGESVTLSPEDGPITRHVTQELSVGIGDVTIAIQPGTGSEASQHKVEQAQEALNDLLEGFGAQTVEEAQQSNSRRRHAEVEVQRVEVAIEAAAAGKDLLKIQEELSDAVAGAELAMSRYEELAGHAAPEQIDLGEAKVKLENAISVRQAAEDARDQADSLLGALSKRNAQEKYMEAVSNLESQRSVEKVRAEALASAREEMTDAAVFASVENRKSELEAAREKLAEASAELARRDADDVEDSLEGARVRVARTEARLSELEKRRNEIRVHLDYFDSANEQLASAEGAVERAEREWAAISRRALAAKTLFEALQEARQESRNAIAAPLLKKMDEYGGGVFGPETVFEMNEALEITSRSNANGTYAVHDLSGGAQEQVDILLRLAVAGVMEGGQGAPVIIDDALGYSDENRLRRMNNAIARAGRDMQVFVLTCDENRFDRVKDARLLKIVDLAMR